MNFFDFQNILLSKFIKSKHVHVLIIKLANQLLIKINLRKLDRFYYFKEAIR